MNLYVFLSALYTLQYVPIVIISCTCIFTKKKEKKNDRTLVWVKIPKFCHNTLLSIFSLGKGRESLRLKPYIKLITSALSDLPPARNDLDKASTTHLKIAQNMYIFSSEFHTFPVTEGMKFGTSISSLQPQQESSPTTQNSSILGQRIAKIQPRKTQILRKCTH